VSDDIIGIGEIYRVKTLVNIRENYFIMLYFWDPEKNVVLRLKEP